MNRKRKAIENVSQRHFRRLKKKYNEYSKVENVISASNLLPIEETQNSAMNSLQQNNVTELELLEENKIAQNVTDEIINNSIVFSQNSDKILISSCITDDGNCHSRNEIRTEAYNLNCIKLQLRLWSLINNIPHTSVTSLLSILKQHPCFNNLPKHAKSLLKTPRTTNVREMPPGQFCYFGIVPILESYFRRYGDKNENHLKLQVGIDGLPISQSSDNQFWPILGSIVPFSEVFLIGCYFGTSKPSDSNLFLEDFVEECKILYKTGVQNNNKIIRFSIHSLIGDAPAKSFVTSTKGHSGYNSCLKCNIEGCYIMNRVCFPGTNFQERTDELANKQFDKNHYKDYSKS